MSRQNGSEGAKTPGAEEARNRKQKKGPDKKRGEIFRDVYFVYLRGGTQWHDRILTTQDEEKAERKRNEYRKRKEEKQSRPLTMFGWGLSSVGGAGAGASG